ncbi:MAG TPA: hypothetical protein VKC17_02815 [Sphingomicrobium sp.]|nr:hypothetical protein [Sphingomicrobium sp.]
MAKLLLILFLGGALSEGLSPHSAPPLLIDAPPTAPLDASN